MKLAKAILALASTVALGACGQKLEDTQAIQEAIELVGPLWQWLEFQDSAEGEEAGNIYVAEPAKYTLSLRSDGSAEIQADCNRVSWTYTLEGSRLTFNRLGRNPLPACDEESHDQLYLQRLANTATYVMADGRLYLNLRADAGNMVFAAPK